MERYWLLIGHLKQQESLLLVRSRQAASNCQIVTDCTSDTTIGSAQQNIQLSLLLEYCSQIG